MWVEIQGSERVNYIIDTIMEQIQWKALYSIGFGFFRVSDTALLVFRGNKNLCILYNEERRL